jgi:hypothetical protein
MLIRDYSILRCPLAVIGEDWPAKSQSSPDPDSISVRIHSETEFTFTSNDDEPPHLGVHIFVVFNFRQIGVVVGHRVQTVQSVHTCRLSEEDGKYL